MENLVKSLGFPVAIVVVLLLAMWVAARAIKGWVEIKGKEDREREIRLSHRLDVVQDAFTKALEETIGKTHVALNRNSGVMERLVETNQHTQVCLVKVDSTLVAVRRRFELGSGDSQKAVGN